jgi:hypothetical protein
MRFVLDEETVTLPRLWYQVQKTSYVNEVLLPTVYVKLGLMKQNVIEFSKGDDCSKYNCNSCTVFTYEQVKVLIGP